MSDEKIALGRKLFFDPRLSINDSVSCSSCHQPSKGFSDQKVKSEGIFGRATERNAPSLLNAGYLPTVLYDAYLPTLEMQVIVPIQEHSEMGITIPALIKKMKEIKEYQLAAQTIFNRPFDAWVLTRSIATYERSLLSLNSRFDQYFYGGDKNALSSKEKQGWKIFSEKLYCTNCHPAPYFTTFQAENNGTYSDEDTDKGRFRVSFDSVDIGKFKIPSLRNCELTFPYMHDGSIENLEQVVNYYASGGSKNSKQHSAIVPFRLSSSEKNEVVLFLKTLSDTSYMQLYR